MLRALVTMCRWLWPWSSPHPTATAAAWLMLGLLRLYRTIYAAGTLNTIGDFHVIVSWVNTRALNVIFENPAFTVDYPPHGWLVLSPMTWIPLSSARWTFPVLSAALWTMSAGLLADWALRLAAPDRHQKHRTYAIALVGMFLSTAATEIVIVWGTNNPIGVCALSLALHQSARRPWLAAAGLAIGLYKLNLAAAVVLVLLALGHWPTVVMGLTGAACLTWCTALLLHRPLWPLLLEYITFVAKVYLGDPLRNDALGVRRLLGLILPEGPIASAGYVLLLLGSLVLLAGFFYTRRGHPRSQVSCSSALWLWSLLLLPQGPYNAGLALVSAWLLMAPASAQDVRSDRAVVIPSLVVLFLVATLPQRLGDWLDVTVLAELFPDVPSVTTRWDELGRVFLWALFIQTVRRAGSPRSQ